jgi:hypothetical protein
MAFTKKNKTLEVLQRYDLQYQESVLVIETKFEPSLALIDDLDFAFKEVDYKSSEAAIRETIIFPILKDCWKHYSKDLAIWIERAISFDKDLSGIPDYLISKKSSKGKIFLDSPFVAVVEAKKDDFIGGWAQCAVEMFAIQKINNTAEIAVYGIVTNGDSWQFSELKHDIFKVYRSSYSLSDVKEVLNAICTILKKCIN